MGNGASPIQMRRMMSYRRVSIGLVESAAPIAAQSNQINHAMNPIRLRIMPHMPSTTIGRKTRNKGPLVISVVLRSKFQMIQVMVIVSFHLILDLEGRS
ncbi:hypothetical protein QJS04_geneDACA005493 [Acorus gramineus]|uniref:Uncharacterized protein n=1 Tax=Acorus gramineus TaxID=55184 RepID=A0AAV9A545_ACOGR|nr:hypothetical protein QJS04_geneDACA005493 [Acorus gramineus]